MNPGDGAAVVETHSAVVILAGDRASKRKEPGEPGCLTAAHLRLVPVGLPGAYGTLPDRAPVLPAAGRPVVLGASSRDSTRRTRARVVGGGRSGAAVDIGRATALRAGPWPEAVGVDSARPPEEVVDMAVAVLACHGGSPCCEA